MATPLRWIARSCSKAVAALPPAVLVSLLATAPVDPAQSATPAVDCEAAEAQWSQTAPPVNLTHVFCGEINRRGRPVGYHALAGERTPGEARIEQRLGSPGAAGAYEARVCIQPDGGGRLRCKRSTLFPDDWTAEEVLDAILQAWRNRTLLTRDGRWCGPSGRGFAVAGWLLPGREVINTAYPDLRGCTS